MSDKTPKPMHMMIPIAKVDEEQRTVWGYATVEELDKHGEIVSYDASKRAFREWPGNIREMHQDIAVGKGIEVKFDEQNKGVWLGAKISESTDGENAWVKVKEGVLQGFSIGGAINDWTTQKMKVDGKDKDVLVVTDYQLAEVSLVDNPAVPSAMFQMVKRAGDHLERVETLKTGQRPKAHWWERMYKFADSQQVMKAELMVYNDSSMAKSKQSIQKDVWSAGMLVDLARGLADHIWMADFEGKPTDNLKGALETIKDAAAKELTEPENWPEEMNEAMELAMSTLNISKSDLEDKMANEPKVEKTITQGQPQRDANADEKHSAEETGRPLNDTKERAEENDLPEVGAVTEQPVVDEKGKKTKETEEVVQGPEYDPKAPQGDADTNVANEEAVAAAEAGAISAVKPKEETEVPVKGGGPAEATTPAAAAEAAEDKGKGKGGKADEPTDLKKSTEQGDLAKSILAGVEAIVKPLTERIEKLENSPADSKAKASYHTVEKGAGMNEEEDKLKAEFDRLNKRADELAANPNEGTHGERVQVALRMRKLARLMDPASRAKHAAVRAQYGGNPLQISK